MTRHTIVLAEEKGTIQRLVKKAVETKPLGQEKIKDVLAVSDENALRDVLTGNLSPSIILLSNTFSNRSQKEVIADLSELAPSAKVIVLTNKYGDRSSITDGAFESVDKPIRNPVLWERIDRAIEAFEEEEVPVVERSPAMAPHAGETEEEQVMEAGETGNPVKKREAVRIDNASVVVISSDEDEEDDDDLFGDEVQSGKREPTPAIETFELMDFPEQGKNHENEIPGEAHVTGSGEENIQSVAFAESEEEMEPVDSDEEEAEEMTDLDNSFAIELEEPDETQEMEVPTHNEVDKENLLVQEPEAISLEEPHSPEKSPASTEHPEVLEPESEINPKSPIYNELSEWTLAHEGFVAKNGEFVSLAPPRARMTNHSSSAGRLPKEHPSRDVPEDGDGLFSSVRNLFKKK